MEDAATAMDEIQDTDEAMDMLAERAHLPPASCWTHGNCHHTGAGCEAKAYRHIADATFMLNTQGESQHTAFLFLLSTLSTHY